MRGASAFFAALVVFASCGGDIDLGGSAGGPCQPCSAASSCQAAFACAQIGGDAYCARSCPNGSECIAGETCQSVVDASGATARACVPSSGACPTVPSPSVDGAAVDHCGSLVGPNVSAGCRACSKSSPTCQPNGCYGGYWCNTAKTDCAPPPKTCS